ncbi:winged helix-turn-helix transcriptional regulator [Algicola sagamiensis]|uniref:winged helix-turn-helix transcriptional regulator n=1 Tax=Algicola sagamiensis TaxID=163869 RepID=UPI00036B8C68|nr:helix-turn-helix domain-containing protein [Algicola sagamiensis]
MRRSDCPIANALDHFGDRWTLLIIRDLALFGKQSYSSLQQSAEQIATNILSSRLSSLEKSGIIMRKPDPSDGRRNIYRLTEAGKDLLPVLIEMLLWSEKYSPEKLAIPDDFLEMAKQDKQALIELLRQRIDNF